MLAGMTIFEKAFRAIKAKIKTRNDELEKSISSSSQTNFKTIQEVTNYLNDRINSHSSLKSLGESIGALQNSEHFVQWVQQNTYSELKEIVAIGAALERGVEDKDFKVTNRLRMIERESTSTMREKVRQTATSMDTLSSEMDRLTHGGLTEQIKSRDLK